MATSKEIDALVSVIMDTKGLDKTNAMAFALGYVTSFIPSTEITKAINYMKDNR
jgi:hypothetical protein